MMSLCTSEVCGIALPNCVEVSVSVKPKYVPPYLRKKQAEEKQGRPSLSFGHILKEKTLSQNSCSSDASTTSTAASVSSCSESASSCSSRSSSPERKRRVHFDLDDDYHDIVDMQFVEAIPLDALVGCEEEGTCWLQYAKRRSSRFHICAHCERICCKKGYTCGGTGLCSLGGELAVDQVWEMGVSLSQLFSAWRCSAKIPATVPNDRLMSGLTWGMQK